ncbi:MAG: hypothetical protein V4754_16320 [Pseudomonadota bacterium]
MSAQKKQRFFPFALAANEQHVSISNVKPIAAALRMVGSEHATLDQQLADAFNANNDVMAYVVGIVNTTLPSIPATPTWYTTFQTAFSNAQIHANGWFPIATNLTSIPNAIVGYAIAFNSSMSTINSLIPVLERDPTNQAALAALLNQIESMIGAIGGYATSANAVNSTIAAFTSHLTADAAILAGAVESSSATQGVDKAQVQRFLFDIDNLQREIKCWQKVETAAAIGAGLGFFIGAVIAIFSLGIGLAFGIVAAAAGITTMVIASQKVRAAKDAVQATNLKMNALTQQAASLAALNTQLNALIALSQAAGTQVALVLKVWHEMEGELAAVAADLANCRGDASKLNLAQLQTDLNLANQSWQTLIGTSSAIAAIKYNQASPALSHL